MKEKVKLFIDFLLALLLLCFDLGFLVLAVTVLISGIGTLATVVLSLAVVIFSAWFFQDVILKNKE